MQFRKGLKFKVKVMQRSDPKFNVQVMPSSDIQCHSFVTKKVAWWHKGKYTVIRFVFLVLNLAFAFVVDLNETLFEVKIGTCDN
jgi:hypothetical protein